jgi:hypothetical protein
MPSTSKAQAHLMSAVAHGWKPTGSAAGIPVGVAKEFHSADKRVGKYMHASKTPRERIAEELAAK